MFAQNKSIAHYTSLKVKHSVLFLSRKYKTYIRLAEQGFLANTNDYRRFIFSLVVRVTGVKRTRFGKANFCRIIVKRLDHMAI